MSRAPSLLAARGVCPRCSRLLVKNHDSIECLACGTLEVPALSREEAASEVEAEVGHRAPRGAGLQAGPPWTAQERETWETWQEGDPVPGETENDKDETEPVARAGTVIASADEMAKACQARITQIDWQVRKLSSQLVVLKDESARLGKVLALLSPKGPRVPRAKAAGDASGLAARENNGPYPCEKCGREFGLPTARGMHQKHCPVLGVG